MAPAVLTLPSTYTGVVTGLSTSTNTGVVAGLSSLPSTSTGVVAGFSSLPSISTGVVGGLAVMAAVVLTLPLTNTGGVGWLVRGGPPSSVKMMRPKSARALSMRCKSSTSSASGVSSFCGLGRLDALDMVARLNEDYSIPSPSKSRKARISGRAAPKSMFEQFTASFPWSSETQSTSTGRWEGDESYIIRNGYTSTGRGHDDETTTPTLEECGTNLTKQAADGKLHPVIGREEQISLVIQILNRLTKKNVCLIGEPGVGKTAIAEALAQRIASGDVPHSLANKKVISLDVGLLVSGTKYRGEFEEKMKFLMEEIKQSDGQVILFIDEMHNLMQTGNQSSEEGGGIDGANLLKPTLARGELQPVILVTTKAAS